MSNKATGAGLILLGLSVYIAIGNAPVGFALFLAALMALSLSRRAHPSPAVARTARFFCTYAPTAIIVTFVAAALRDFDRYLTRADFGMYYSAALQLRTDPARLYDLAAQSQMLELVTGGLKNHYLSFPYPAFVAAVFVPLTWLPFHTAYWVMAGFNIILAAAVVFLLCRSFCTEGSQVVAVALTASVLFPLYVNVVLGQTAFAGMALYSLLISDLLNKKTTRAGLWVALLSYKIVLMPVPFLLLLLRRAWRGVLVAVSVSLVLVLLSLSLVGTAGIRANLRVMTMMTDESLITRMQSLRGLTHFLGMPGWVFWLLGTVIAGALVLGDRRGADPKWILAAAVLAALLISPYLQMYDVSLALPAIALAISTLSRVPDWQRSAFILLAFVPSFAGVAGLVTGRNVPAVPFTALAAFCYCLYRASVDKAVTAQSGRMPQAASDAGVG